MNKISINLLPKEVLLQRAHSSKFALVNKISIGMLVTVILITTGVMLIKISQNREIEQINNEVKLAEDNVIAQKSKEETLLALKNRLSSIQTLLGSDEKVKAMFNLIVFLIPPEIDLHDATVDKNGTIIASFNSKSLSAIDALFSSLSNKETNLNLVSSVDLDGISMGKGSTYRFALKIASIK